MAAAAPRRARRIFSLEVRDSKRLAREAPDRLEDQTSRFLRERLLRVVTDATSLSSRPWQEESWIAAKQYLHDTMCLQLLSSMYDSIFAYPTDLSSVVISDVSHVPITTGVAPCARHLPPRKLFLLWWFFLDIDRHSELTTPEFDVTDEFYLQLVHFFSSEKTRLTAVTLSYNWIVRGDFVRAFANLQELKSLTLTSHVNDDILNISSQCCAKLQSLNFKGTLTLKMSREAFHGFLASQSSTLTSLNLTALNDVLPSIYGTEEQKLPLMEALSNCKMLQKLSINGECMAYSSEATVLSVRELVLNFRSQSDDRGHQRLDLVPNLCPKLASLTLIEVLIDEKTVDNLGPLGHYLTEMTCHVTSKVRLWQLLKHCRVVKRLNISYVSTAASSEKPEHCTPPPPRSFALPLLKDFVLKNGEFVHHDELIDLVSCSPALMRLLLTVKRIIDFDITSLLQILKQGKAFTQLRTLELDLRERLTAAPITTTALLMALVNLPDIRVIRNVLWCKLSNRAAREMLLKTAREKDMRIIFANRDSHAE